MKYPLHVGFYGKESIYANETNKEPILESTAENRALSFYRAVLHIIYRLYGVSAYFVACDESL